MSVRKKDSIDAIKLIGREHAFLTGTMDQMNFCYSFQVSFSRFMLIILIDGLQSIFNVKFQIMYSTACTFLLTIFMLYSICRYIFLPSDFYRQQSLIHSEWEMTYLCVVIMVIYNASRLTREVCMRAISAEVMLYIEHNEMLNVLSIHPLILNIFHKIYIFAVFSRWFHNLIGKTNGTNRTWHNGML